jgi:predicted AAA+ superfamily ATPase
MDLEFEADSDIEYGLLSKIFSSKAVAQILDFFLDHKEFDYSANEIAKKTGLSFRTIFREIPDLEANQLIFNTRRIGKANMYKLNTDLNAVLLLEKFALEMSQVVLAETTSTETQDIERKTKLMDENRVADDGVVTYSTHYP